MRGNWATIEDATVRMGLTTAGLWLQTWSWLNKVKQRAVSVFKEKRQQKHRKWCNLKSSVWGLSN